MSPRSPRFDLAVAVAIGFFCLAIYLATACPTIYVGDSAEFSEATAVFGIPHPPGYPLYTLLGGLFARVARWGDFGHRANVFSAVCAALTASALWLWLRQQKVARVAAALGTLTLASGVVFWSQAVCAEVHALNCLLLVMSLGVASRAAEQPTRARMFLCGITVGLLVGHRNLNLIFVPGVLAGVALRWVRLPRRADTLIAMLAGGVTSLALYAYLPLAASHHPPLAMGEPDSWSRFFFVVTAHPYVRHLASTSAATSARRLSSFLLGLPANLGVAIVAVPLGIGTLRRSEGGGASLFALAWIGVTCAVFSSLYNVLDVESYFLPTLVCLAAIAAIGFARHVHRRGVAVGLALATAGLMAVNFSSVNLKHQRIGRQYGEDLLNSVPPDGLLLSFGDTATHALWYLQDVENRRPDVVTVSVDEISAWYLARLSRRSEVDWPPLGPAEEWLPQLVKRNLASRRICMTQPMAIAPPGWTPLPSGLVFCLGERGAAEGAVAASLEFWNRSTVPAAREGHHGDIHEEMTLFAYALARYNLVRLLVAMDREGEARAQAGQLVASHPDKVESAIEASLSAVGRQVSRRFEFAARAQQLLSMPRWDRPALLQIFELN